VKREASCPTSIQPSTFHFPTSNPHTADSKKPNLDSPIENQYAMNEPDASQDPAFLPAMILIGILLVLSVAGVVHSLIMTFAG
jgi:hypothetical protein